MKIILGVVVLAVIAVLGFFMWGPDAPSSVDSVEEGTENSPSLADASVVAPGTYVVVPEESTVTWAGKKPLIEGYINSGTLGVSLGTITVSEGSATGTFTIAMDTLSVGLTAKKPGSEDALESHLKGERWFNVAEFKTATFVITKITERPESATTFMYDVAGNLTLKGQTHPLSFPAKIYQDIDGVVHASADLEFDRTLWGLTASSADFFDNLADNAVDDMVALSFHLKAVAN